ncbi:MAG: GNAT family N-acetyltransferase [Bryobacteraceae bacterium]
MGSVRVSIERARSITEIDASEWDRLAGSSVATSHAWLRTLEDCAVPETRCQYVVARGPAGLVAAAVGRVHELSGDVIDLDHALFGRFTALARRLGLSTLPALVCGTRIGVAGPVLVDGGTPSCERGPLMNAVVQALEETAKENRWTLCFREVPCNGSPLRGVLGARGYIHTREMPTAYLDIAWKTFEEFRRHLRATHPATAKNLSREVNHGNRNGVVIEQIEDPTRYGDRLHRLLDSHYRRLNRRPFPFDPRFLERLKSRLGARALIYVASIDGEPVGVLVGVKDDESLYLPIIGIDKARARPGAVYFNLGYNRPIRDSIAAGHRRVYFGKLLYAMKASRGCKALDGKLYYRDLGRSRTAVLRLLFSYRSRKVGALSAAIPREPRLPSDYAF